MSATRIRQQPTSTVELAIGGMTCAACAARVEQRLNALPSVTATVNIATERARVELAAAVPEDELIAAVEAAGYRATRVGAGAPASGAEADGAQVRSLWRRLVVAFLLFLPVCDLSLAFWLSPGFRFSGWQWLLLALSLPVVTWAAWPFHQAALRAARHGAATMDTLVSIGIVASTCWSIYVVFFVDTTRAGGDLSWGILLHPARGGIYFDVAVGVTTFLLAGRLFEARARRSAGAALRGLLALGARDASVLVDDATERRVPIAELEVGDRFVVRPGETVATDGRVVFGEAALDTSAMTGEALPSDVGVGDAVLGGVVALSGRLIVCATRVGSDTQLAGMVRLVEQAQSVKGGMQRLADRISSIFVPAVLVLAALTLAAWMTVSGSPARAFSAALAVLIIACPCALGLATPMALMVSSGRAAELGIFVKRPEALEAARGIDTVVLDKTGTVTAGRPQVVGVWTVPGTRRTDLLAYAGAVEDASEHAIARAVSAFARSELGALRRAGDFRSEAGNGVRGIVGGREVVAGRPQMLTEHGFALPAPLVAELRRWDELGRSSVVAAWDGTVRGMFAVADEVKPSARGAIAQLDALGLGMVLMTGDNERSAHAVAARLGISDVIANALPKDKATVIRRLQAEGRRVALVGDGVNDAPALATADLGMAIGAGTDIALDAADLILVRDNLAVVPTAIGLARRTVGTIRGNLVWAFAYNLAALPVAALGLLNPLIAAAAMACSSGFVVANSLRLRRVGVPVPAAGNAPLAPAVGGVETDASLVAEGSTAAAEGSMAAAAATRR